MSNVNLAEIPDFWNVGEWGIAENPDCIHYPVIWQGRLNCIQLDPNPRAIARDNPCIAELDGRWKSIKPGDHIVCKAWLFAENSTVGDKGLLVGAQWGLDLYDAQRTTEITTPDGTPTYILGKYTPEEKRTLCCVRRGTNAWKQIVIDFIVQPSYYADPWGGYRADEIVIPTSFVPYVIVRSEKRTTEKGRVWVADTEVYINPIAEVFTCSVCGQTFDTAANLAIHMQSVHPPTPFVCPYCGATFSTQADLTAHINSVHNYICLICGAVFTSQADLDAHMASIHGTQPPPPSPMWIATECGLSQADIDKLRIFGHTVLSQTFIDLYHTDGKDLAEFLKTHPETKLAVKRLLKTVLKIV